VNDKKESSKQVAEDEDKKEGNPTSTTKSKMNFMTTIKEMMVKKKKMVPDEKKDGSDNEKDNKEKQKGARNSLLPTGKKKEVEPCKPGME